MLTMYIIVGTWGTRRAANFKTIGIMVSTTKKPCCVYKGFSQLCAMSERPRNGQKYDAIAHGLDCEQKYCLENYGRWTRSVATSGTPAELSGVVVIRIRHGYLKIQ